MSTSLIGYNLGYLDEQTKRMIRRALLKAVAIPGFQVPFASREVPMPRGWGTGGVQVTAAIVGEGDVLKVIDQGADDTTNAVSIRAFFASVARVATTTRTDEATVIQTRHRIPETPLADGQVVVYQVPVPEPLRFLEPRETETRRLHALEEYGLMYVKLYEDIYQKVSNPDFDNAVSLLVRAPRYAFSIPLSPASAEFKQAWTDAVNRVLNGQQTPRQALDQAQREAQAAIDKAK